MMFDFLMRLMIIVTAPMLWFYNRVWIGRPVLDEADDADDVDDERYVHHVIIDGDAHNSFTTVSELKKFVRDL